jgi:spore germination protein YaaH
MTLLLSLLSTERISSPFMRSPAVLFRILLLATVLGGGLPFFTNVVLAQSDDSGLQTVFYTVDSEHSYESFEAHRDHVSIVGPQTFSVDGDGMVWGEVSPQLVEQAQASDTRVVPLVINSGFNQEMMHSLLTDSTARARALSMMVRYAKRYDFDGWQFDFENIRATDRDRYTTFCQEASQTFEQAGLSFSIAMVPRNSNVPGPTSYHRWIYANWRGPFDLNALADTADFLSLMTYDQHTSGTTPGPIAGVPWVESIIQFALDQGVPARKISLGIPLYSGHWQPEYDEDTGAGSRRNGTPHATVERLLERHNAELRWNDAQKVYHTHWAHTGVFEYLFVEEKRSFRAKLDLIREYNLRGFSAWRLGQEDPEIWDVLEQDVTVR